MSKATHNFISTARGAALIAGILAMAAPAAAQEKSGWLHEALGLPDTFLLSGSNRVRYEVLRGQSRAGFAAKDDLISVRTSLLGEYRGDGFRIGAELYDSRSYGADVGSAIGTGEVNTLELVQAYVSVKDIAVPSLDAQANVQAGRFTLNLGSRRLVAADDYRNTTNGYTGVRLDLRNKGGLATTIFYTLPQQRRPDDISSIRNNAHAFDRENFNAQLWGSLISRPALFGKTLGEISYVGFAERDQVGRPTRNRHLHTVGGRLLLAPSPGHLDYEAEGLYQFGRVRSSIAKTAASLDVAAGFVHLDLGYSFRGSLKARLSVEYDYASGDGASGKFGRFDTLFGMRRADLAPSGIYAQIGRANISTPGVRLEINPTRRFDAFAVYRAMWLANRRDAFSTSGRRDTTGRSGSFAGHQLEARARYWVIPDLLRGEVNAAWLLKGGFLKDAPASPTTDNSRYISLALTTFF